MAKMLVEFMVEDNEYFNSDMAYKIVERYRQPEYPYGGYEIYRVETDDIKKIRVVNNTTDIEYVPYKLETCKSGNDTVHFVKIWDPVNN